MENLRIQLLSPGTDAAVRVSPRELTKRHRGPSTAPVQGKAILPPPHWAHTTLDMLLQL